MQFRSVASSGRALLFLLLFSVQDSLQSDSIGDQRTKQLDARSVSYQRETSKRRDPRRLARATEGDSQGNSIKNQVSGSVEFPKAAPDFSHSESIENQGSPRLSRATPEEFSATLDQISAGARLVSAISLINGLVDKSITPNSAITELLSIGGVDVDKLKTFDKQNVPTAVQKLVALQQSVASNSVSADLQTMMVLLDSWKQQYEEMGDVKNIEAAKEYFDDVQKSQGYVLTADFSTSVTDIKRYTLKLELLVNVVPAKSNTQGYMDDMNDVVEKMSPFAQRLSDDLSDAIKSLQQFENLTRRDFIVDSPQRKFMNLLNEIGNASRIVGIGNPAAEQELKVAATTVHSSLSGPAGDDLFHLGEIASSQLHNGRFASKLHTSGLLNGYADLEKVDGDVVDPAMEPLLGGFDNMVLQQGLAPLKAVASGAADVYNEWSQLMTPQSVHAAEQLGQVTRWFGALKTPITDDALKNVIQFGIQAPPSIGFSSNFNTLLEEAISLRSTLLTVRQKAEVLQKSQSMKDLELVSEMKSYLPNSRVNNINDMPQLIEKFQNFTDRHKVLNALNDLKSKLQDISDDLTRLDIVSTVQNLPNGLNVVNAFVGHADVGKVATYFGGLNGKSKDLKSCSETVQLIRQIRKFRSDQVFARALDTMSDVVIASLPKVASLLNVTSKIVTEQDEKVKKLARLKDLEKTSKNLGDSVMVLHNIQSVMGNKTNFTKFMEKGYFIDTAILHSQSTNKMQLTADWGNFNETAKQLDRMLMDLEYRRDSSVLSNGTTFASFASLFAGFKGLQSVNWEVGKRLKVLDKLIPNSYAQEAKQYLDGLKILDLNFARSTVPLLQISTTLANVDMYFVAGTAPLPPPVVVANSTVAVNTATVVGGSPLQGSQPTESSALWGIVGCVLLVVLVCAAAAGTTMFVIRRRKAKTAGKGDGKSKSSETEKKGGFWSRLFKKKEPVKKAWPKLPPREPAPSSSASSEPSPAPEPKKPAAPSPPSPPKFVPQARTPPPRRAPEIIMETARPDEAVAAAQRAAESAPKAPAAPAADPAAPAPAPPENLQDAPAPSEAATQTLSEAPPIENV